MITCCLSRPVSSAASSRPTMSVLPPGGHGMMIRTGFSGQLAAGAIGITASDTKNNARLLSGSDRQFIGLPKYSVERNSPAFQCFRADDDAAEPIP